MNHCKDCRHWVPLQEWGLCELAACEWGKRTHQDTLAYARDAEGRQAFLVTRPDFGCVQWAESPWRLSILIDDCDESDRGACVYCGEPTRCGSKRFQVKRGDETGWAHDDCYVKAQALPQ